MTEAIGRDKVFVSYSHQDTWWLNELMRMMAPYARSGKILLWSDSDIPTGSHWREEIDKALGEARVAVLAVSDHFMQSDFIHRVELPALLLEAENEGVKICWCLLSACIYEDTPIGSLQAAHDISISFDKMSPAQRKEALKIVANKVMFLYENISPSLTRQMFDGTRAPQTNKGSKANTAVLKETDWAIVEITIDRTFDDFTHSDQEKLLQGIARILSVSDAEIRIRNKRRGSIIFELEVSPALAEQLIFAARQGRLEELGIARACLISQIGSSRTEAVRKYFRKTPIKPDEPDYSGHQIKMIFGGGLLSLALILFFSISGVNILLSIALGYFGIKLLANGFSLYSKQKRKYEEDCKQYEKDYEMAEPKPSDEQMDKWLKDDIEKIRCESLRRLGLDSEDYIAEPHYIGGPARGLEETKYAIGKDGKTRFSHFNILIVYFINHHLAAYQSLNSIENGVTLFDSTQEFPYQEITKLGTHTVKDEIIIVGDNVVSERGFQEFTLATSGANQIKVTFSFARNMDSHDELVIGGEDTISVIRKKLQEYKTKFDK
jgi:hypothetical protein